MIVATPGLVLHTTKYSESSVIAKIFTRQLGVRSYILKGVRNTRSRTKQNLLQPLSHVDLAVYDSPRATINYVKDIHLAGAYPNIAMDSARMALVFFMNEILLKLLREEDPQPEVFDYVVSELERIDGDSLRFSTQPQLFLLRLSALLGVEPMNNYSLGESLFSLREGRFVQPPTLLDSPEALYPLLDSEQSLQFHYVLASLHGGEFPAEIDHHQLLMNLIEYLGIHMPECRDLKSVDVLHALL